MSLRTIEFYRVFLLSAFSWCTLLPLWIPTRLALVSVHQTPLLIMFNFRTKFWSKPCVHAPQRVKLPNLYLMSQVFSYIFELPKLYFWYWCFVVFVWLPNLYFDTSVSLNLWDCWNCIFDTSVFSVCTAKLQVAEFVKISWKQCLYCIFCTWALYVSVSLLSV